jgi:hypothetical protein
MKALKKIFLLIFLLPIIPALSIPDDDKGGDKGSDTGDDDKTGGDDNKDDDKDSKKDAGKGKTFTQEEVDALINRRFAREKKAWEKAAEEEKKKAAMTETEKLKTEKEEADKKAIIAMEKASQRLIRAEVISQAAKLDIIDPEAVYSLIDKSDIEVDDNDKVKGVKEALETLIKEKSYLISSDNKDTKKTGDDQSNDKSKKSGFNMNDLIRKAAGRT